MSKERDIVINFMNNIEGKTPILLIAKAANLFRKIYRGRIYKVDNEDDMKILQDMSLAKLKKPVVLDNVSYLYSDEDLLKLIEETTLKIILLASKDNLSDVLMSRCTSYLKLPEVEVKPCNFVDKLSAYRSIDTEEMSVQDIDTFLMTNCPSLIMDFNSVKCSKYKDRLIEIIVGIGDL